MLNIKEKLSSKINSYKTLTAQLEKELEEHESLLLSDFDSGKRIDTKRFVLWKNHKKFNQV